MTDLELIKANEAYKAKQKQFAKLANESLAKLAKDQPNYSDAEEKAYKNFLKRIGLDVWKVEYL